MRHAKWLPSIVAVAFLGCADAPPAVDSTAENPSTSQAAAATNTRLVTLSVPNMT